MSKCHERGCTKQATYLIKLKTENITAGIEGFTIPACREHVGDIREVVEHICEGKDVAAQVVPIESDSVDKT